MFLCFMYIIFYICYGLPKGGFIMQEEIRDIVFDMDDILWGLNDRVCERLGIDIRKVTNFTLWKCNQLTEKEQQAMLHAYAQKSTFQNIVFFKKVKDLIKLETKNTRVSICSNSRTKDIADEKTEQLKAHIPGIRDDQIIMNIIDIKDHTKKKLIKNIWRFADDSPYNIASSDAQFNYSLKYAWNQSEAGREIIAGKPIMFFNEFEEIFSHLQHDIKMQEYIEKIS